MEDIMEVRTQSKEGSKVANVEQCLKDLQQQLDALQRRVVGKLRNKPQQFAVVEEEIHATMQALADQLTASVLAEATTNSVPLEAAKKKYPRLVRGV
jgi:primosomal protein N''